MKKCDDINQLKAFAELLKRRLADESPFLKGGVMGAVLFFYFIYRQNQEDIYREFADRLLDRLVDGLNGCLSLDFTQGLSEIGWGIEYLMQLGILSDDSDIVLEDFDLLFRERLMAGDLDIYAVVGISMYLAQKAQSRCDRPAGMPMKRIKRNMLLCLRRLEADWVEKAEQDKWLLLQYFGVLTDFYQFNVCRFKVLQLLERVRALLRLHEVEMNEIQRCYKVRLSDVLSDCPSSIVVSDGQLYLLAGHRHCIPLLPVPVEFI